jgi:deazaflavin-dependent oxidoreductase (nitroreductase family)
MAGRVKRGFLWLIKRTLNRVTARAARSGSGHFSLMRSVGRKTGKSYETPIILASVPGGFVCELTYGPDVAWYRNVVAAGHCEVVVRGVTHAIDRIEPYGTEEGIRAFGLPYSIPLRLLRRRDYRFLHEASAAREPGISQE